MRCLARPRCRRAWHARSVVRRVCYASQKVLGTTKVSKGCTALSRPSALQLEKNRRALFFRGTPGKIRTYDIRLRRPWRGTISPTKSLGVTAP
jgi:hypothetical protein